VAAGGTIRGSLERVDASLLGALRTHGHWAPFERAVAEFSRSGEHSRLWLAAGAAGAVLQPARRGLYLRLVLTVCSVEVANAVTKLVVGRRRPVLDGLPPLAAVRSPRSFPSAHAATSFAAARMLAQALPPAPVYAVAGLMASSRAYLGVHYPSDVVGGIALGLAIAEVWRGTKASTARGR
jgi:undecaprenyl-diphosphatase